MASLLCSSNTMEDKENVGCVDRRTAGKKSAAPRELSRTPLGARNTTQPSRSKCACRTIPEILEYYANSLYKIVQFIQLFFNTPQFKRAIPLI